MTKDPDGPLVGQLFDDMDSIDTVLLDETLVCGFSLVQVASLLRLLGETHSC